MGPYCQYCGSRCFVPRKGAQLGSVTILASCRSGMAHDLKTTGYTHRTAINPIMKTRDELADGRRLSHPKLRGFTLNAGIATLTISQLMESGQLTGQAVACLAGVPEVYDAATRVRRYPVSA